MLSSSPGFPAYGFNKDLVTASQRKLAHSDFYITPGGRAKYCEPRTWSNKQITWHDVSRRNIWASPILSEGPLPFHHVYSSLRKTDV